MKKILIAIFAIVISTSVTFFERDVKIDKYYYECYTFRSANDSSFYAYQLDYEVDSQLTGGCRVYSILSTGDDTWMAPGYKDIRRLENSIERRNWNIFSTYLSAATDTVIVWNDPLEPKAHKYLGPVEIGSDGLPGYLFQVFYFLCNDEDIVPTPFFSEYDNNMVLFYSKHPAVDKLNVPFGAEYASLDEMYTEENWSYDFNPIISCKRIEAQDVPKRIRKNFKKIAPNINKHFLWQ